MSSDTKLTISEIFLSAGTAFTQLAHSVSQLATNEEISNFQPKVVSKKPKVRYVKPKKLMPEKARNNV